MVRAVLFVVALFAVCALSRTALADEPAPASTPQPEGPPDEFRRVRELMQQRRFAEARDILVRMYQLYPQPQLLFTLGQIEFNLENFPKAIEYYQKFLDSRPGPDEAALAQQAIGAARARIVAPPPKVIERDAPRPAYERDWDVWSTSLVAVGGATVITGAIVLVHGYQLGHDVPPAMASQYRARLDRAKRWQWAGAGVATAGALIAGAAFVRFAVHRVEVAPIAPGPSPGAMGLALERAW